MTHTPLRREKLQKNFMYKNLVGTGNGEAKWHLHAATKQRLRSWDVTSTCVLSVSAAAHTLVEIHLQQKILML